MALRLFLHAFQTIFGNFDSAVKASVIPFAIIGLIGWLVLGLGGGAILTIIFAIGLFFTFGFVASSWHRYVLLEEEPRLNGPATDRAFPYLWKSILLGLWLLLMLLPVIFLMGLVGFPLLSEDGSIGSGAPEYGLEDFAFELVFGTISGSIILMYSMVLPATALERQMTFRESRLATMKLGGDIFVLALLMVLLNLVSNFVLLNIIGLGGFIGMILSLAVQWLVMMVGISILTTLYGHLVEGRDLPT